MAIELIPPINASFSSNGFVYGIDFQRSYSSEPSKVTYKIINKSGQYITPSIEANASINFSGFNFDGYVYSYEIEESNSGNILTVTLIDKSVILDKLYVVVFRPGLFNESGNKKTVKLDVKFTEDDVFYTVKRDGAGFRIVKNNYKNGQVDREVRSLNRKIGDIIIVGSEEPADTKCELPACSYTFDDLKGITGVSGFSSCPISDKSVRQTYEGSLRSVLNSWCQDFGYSFYWDYSANTLRFFDTTNPVFSIPNNVNDKKITSKKYSASAEGKYNQISANYFARPYNPKTGQASLSETFFTTSTLNPYNWAYFLVRDLSEDEYTKYGGGRTRDEFIKSAVLGYVSPSLRKIYNYTWISTYGNQIGVSSGYKVLDASKIGTVMKDGGLREDVNDLVDFSGSKIDALNNSYHAFLAKYDAGLENKWTAIEQDIFTGKIGNFYRCPPTKSGETVFCTSKMIVRTSISFDPEGSIMEDGDNPADDSGSFKGRPVFSRGAPGPEKTSMQALKALGIEEENSKAIEKLLPLQIPILHDSAIYKNLIKYNLVSAGDLAEYNTLFIVPKKDLVSEKIKFSVSGGGGGQNKRETTYMDIDNNKDPSPPKCNLEDPNEKKCLSGKEELMRKQRGDIESDVQEKQKPTAGLISKGPCEGARIAIDGQSVTVLSSSYAQYRSVITYGYSVEAILDDTQQESLIFKLSGSTSSSSKIIQTRLIVENRTTAENLSKEIPTPEQLATRDGHLQNRNMEKVAYTCAGFVGSLPLSAGSGLENLDMSISDSGFSASYSYSTRPPSFVRQDDFAARAGSISSQPANQVR
jgi:hypothetical protein